MRRAKLINQKCIKTCKSRLQLNTILTQFVLIKKALFYRDLIYRFYFAKAKVTVEIETLLVLNIAALHCVLQRSDGA